MSVKAENTLTLHTDMKILAFLKEWSLAVSLCLGTIIYLTFSHVGVLEPFGDEWGPRFVELMPVILFVLLYVTFCKIELREMKPQTWHFLLQAIRATMSGLLVLAINLVDNQTAKLVLEGAFICVICPTAAAAPVITEKLGGSIGSLTTYTIIANIVTMIIIPLFFPMVEKGADITFMTAAMMVFRNVTTVLVVPLLLALLTRRFLPKFAAIVKRQKNLGFYLWCFNLMIVSGLTIRNITHARVSGWLLVVMLVLPLFITIAQFGIGKAVGHPFGARISAGQALGQKNTVIGIWLTITFLNPLAAVSPGAYVIWQNLVNAWQIWCKDKYGKLKW